MDQAYTNYNNVFKSAIYKHVVKKEKGIKMKNIISKLLMVIILHPIFLTLSCISNDIGRSSKELPLDLIESIKSCSGSVWGEKNKILYYTTDGILWQHSIENNSKKEN